MSSYVTTGSDTVLAVKAGIFPIRLSRIDFVSNANGGYWVYAYSVATPSISGGTRPSVTPLRQGAPQASAVAYEDPSVSGGSTFLGIAYANPNSSSNPGYSQPSSTASIQPPLTTTIGPGQAIYVSGLGDPGNLLATIYFEELRLDGSL